MGGGIVPQWKQHILLPRFPSIIQTEELRDVALCVGDRGEGGSSQFLTVGRV